MSYLTDEQQAEEALEWWGRYPDSIEALVSLSDDTASDEHGNVIGHVEWQYHPAFKIMLAGSNGLVYSTRHAKQASGWNKFYLIDAEKETQRIFKRRLQASNKATKMNTQSNDTGSTDMATFNESFDQFPCIGDTIEVEIDGMLYEAEIVPDNDSAPYEADCYSGSQVKAWKDDEWYYVGIVISATTEDGWHKDHVESLWGIELGLGDNDSEILTETANGLLKEALK